MRFGRDRSRPTAPSEPCNRRGCPEGATHTCSYVDRRSRACGTRWCATHSEELYSARFCARHASTMRAIGPNGVVQGLIPELDNRVPSLAFWVGRDLNDDITSVLQSTLSDPHESLAVDDVTLIAGGGRNSERRWERNWKVLSHAGIRHRVTVGVVEAAPTEVVVRVGSRPVMRSIPPWISAREAGKELAPEDDAMERRIYYRQIHNAILDGLRQEDEAGERYSVPMAPRFYS